MRALRPEEELALLRVVQGGQDASDIRLTIRLGRTYAEPTIKGRAQMRLLDSMEGLVVRVLEKRKEQTAHIREDLKAECQAHILNAMETYDLDSGWRFSTHTEAALLHAFDQVTAELSYGSALTHYGVTQANRLEEHADEMSAAELETAEAASRFMYLMTDLDTLMGGTEDDLSGEAIDWAGDPEDEAEGPEEFAVRLEELAETSEVLDYALARVDEDQRELLELKYLGSSPVTDKQIAEATGVPLRTVERRLAEARRALRKEVLRKKSEEISD